MKTASHNSSNWSEDSSKHDENKGRFGGGGEKDKLEDIPLPSSSGSGKKDETDGPSQVLAWVADASKEFTPKLGSPDIKELENMTSLYLAKVSSCISKCYVPNRAAKMKRCMNDVLMFFNFMYQEISEDKKAYSSYLDKMSELMAYYIDMEIQASSRAKENPLVIASKLTSALFIFLDKSHDHILDSILKANNINKNFWELCSLIFSSVLKETPKKVMSDLTYVRYILAFKMWKRVVQGPHERKRVMSLASLRLKAPPQFVEKTRAGLLNGIIPKVPKKRSDVTTFLIQAKFDVKEKAKAFLKYVSESKTNVMFVPSVPAVKTDIPLLVGYLPDFGPSLSLVKLDAPNLDEEDSKKVDISGSRLMNEIWTSVNHEASFREAIRMQNVTTFNRFETKMNEKKKIHCILKHKKIGKAPAGNKTIPESMEVTDSGGTPRTESPDVTIVLSDDSETVEVHRKPRINRVSKPPPVVQMKQEKLSPTPTEELGGVSLLKEGPLEAVLPPVAAKQPLMNPSQIKQEVDIDDCIIMESPEPSIANELEAVTVEDKETIDEDHRSSVELEVSVSLKKAGVSQPSSPCTVPISDIFTKEAAINDCACDFKEEKEVEVPTKEKEINIRINRDLFDKIKYQDECEKEVAHNDPTKPAEIALADSDKVGITTDKEGLTVGSPDTKSDTALFDDEENSWSPSGGSQEFLRNVVNTFISQYGDDVDTRLSSGNVVSETPLEVDVVVESKDLPSCGLFGDAMAKNVLDHYFSVDSNKNPEIRNESLQDSIDVTSPPAKRCRVDDLHVNHGDLVEEIVPVSKSTDNIAEQVEEPSKPYEGEEFAEPRIRALHNSSCRWDHRVFILQTELRDILPSNVTTPIPSPIEMDPVTGKPVERCSCSQCVGNFEALIFNHKALVGFQNEWILKGSREPENDGSTPGADTTAVIPTPEEFEPKQEDTNLEADEDGNGNPESGPQLPFKKRKALVNSDERKDDGESQHSDTSKDGIYYPSTPMLSIADLETAGKFADSAPSPPLPDDSFNKLPSVVRADNASCTSLSRGTSFSAGDSAPARGGFPYIASTETLNTTTLPGGSSYNLRSEHTTLPTDFDINYTSAYPSSSYSNNPPRELLNGYSGLFTSRPPGGGFPPFNAVIPPHTNFSGVASRLEQHSADSSASGYSTDDRSSQRTTRRFVTPAQLKQAFIAKDERSCTEETSCEPHHSSRSKKPSRKGGTSTKDQHRCVRGCQAKKRKRRYGRPKCTCYKAMSVTCRQSEDATLVEDGKENGNRLCKVYVEISSCGSRREHITSWQTNSVQENSQRRRFQRDSTVVAAPHGSGELRNCHNCSVCSATDSVDCLESLAHTVLVLTRHANAPESPLSPSWIPSVEDHSVCKWKLLSLLPLWSRDTTATVPAVWRQRRANHGRNPSMLLSYLRETRRQNSSTLQRTLIMNNAVLR